MAGQQSHYEINVSRDGGHLFATAERSCVTKHEALRLLDILRERFPEGAGYKVTCTHWETIGREFDFSEDECRNCGTAWAPGEDLCPNCGFTR